MGYELRSRSAAAQKPTTPHPTLTSQPKGVEKVTAKPKLPPRGLFHKTPSRTSMTAEDIAKAVQSAAMVDAARLLLSIKESTTEPQGVDDSEDDDEDNDDDFSEEEDEEDEDLWAFDSSSPSTPDPPAPVVTPRLTKQEAAKALISFSKGDLPKVDEDKLKKLPPGCVYFGNYAIKLYGAKPVPCPELVAPVRSRRGQGDMFGKKRRRTTRK